MRLRQGWKAFLGQCGVLDPLCIVAFSFQGGGIALWEAPQFYALEDLRSEIPAIEDSGLCELEWSQCKHVLLVGSGPLPSEPGTHLIGLIGTYNHGPWDWRPAYLKRCMCCETINLTDMRRGLRCRSCGEPRVHGFAHGIEEMMWGCK